MPTCLLFLTPKKSIRAILLMPSEFLQVRVVALIMHCKVSLRVICKTTLLLATFFHLCICSVLHHPSYMWRWRDNSGRGELWLCQLQVCGLALRASPSWLSQRSTHRARPCRKDGPFLQAGFFRHWKGLVVCFDKYNCSSS